MEGKEIPSPMGVGIGRTTLKLCFFDFYSLCPYPMVFVSNQKPLVRRILMLAYTVFTFKHDHTKTKPADHAYRWIRDRPVILDLPCKAKFLFHFLFIGFFACTWAGLRVSSIFSSITAKIAHPRPLIVKKLFAPLLYQHLHHYCNQWRIYEESGGGSPHPPRNFFGNSFPCKFLFFYIF